MTSLRRFAAFALIGVVAGFVGGAFSASPFARRGAAPKQPNVIRARQFDAIGEDGKVRARFGLDSGDVPIVRLFGLGEKERFSIMLDNVDEPIMVMEDINGNTPAYLGHETSDTANPIDDDWSLSFHAPGDDDRLAVVGMMRSYPSRKHIGAAGVRDVSGKWYSVASK